MEGKSMIAKKDLIALYKKEFATTLRVLKAFPEGKDDFRPHERSSTILGLTATFVFEMYLLEMQVFGNAMDRSVFQNYKPANIQTVIQDFEKECAQVLKLLEQLPESDINKPVTFAGRTFVADEFALMMLHDQIHHRGQLSVYVRMAGGKVPSIYGPSADDPTPNL
jgi:uncharacterized damage-inducible protein DinB